MFLDADQHTLTLSYDLIRLTSHFACSCSSHACLQGNGVVPELPLLGTAMPIVVPVVKPALVLPSIGSWVKLRNVKSWVKSGQVQVKPRVKPWCSLAADAHRNIQCESRVDCKLALVASGFKLLCTMACHCRAPRCASLELIPGQIVVMMKGFVSRLWPNTACM